MIAALAVVWVLAHAPVLRWAAWTWTEQAHSRENWVLVGAGALYVATRAPWRAPLLAWGPAALIVACAAAGRLLAATWQVHVLEAALFVLGAWGIAGLCLDRGAWRAGWPAALATVVLLPFDGALDTFLGFPLRLATAKAVAAALGTGSADTLIRFENHVAQVDVPCSGVGGLWTGTVLLLVAAAVEGRRLGARFVALWVATLGALVVANFARVLALAMLLPWPTVATVLHVPLGVLTFGVVVGIAVVGLRFVPRAVSAAPEPARQGSPGPLLALGALVLALAAPTPTASAHAADVPAVALAVEGLALSPVPFTDAERRVFASQGARAASKWTFPGGSLVVVRADGWRAHHSPAGCHRAEGRDAGSPETRLLDGAPYALARTGEGVAAWWFTSPSGDTADFTARVWGEVVSGERDWTMVSLLAEPGTSDADVDALVRALRGSLP